MGYILQQIEKPSERKNEDSDDEGGEEEEDAEEPEEFEADLDISDCYPTPPKKDFLQDYLIPYRTVPDPTMHQIRSESHDFLRPTTPGQRRLDFNTVYYNVQGVYKQHLFSILILYTPHMPFFTFSPFFENERFFTVRVHAFFVEILKMNSKKRHGGVLYNIGEGVSESLFLFIKYNIGKSE